MGCTFSSPLGSGGLTWYIDPVGPAAGDSFGLPGFFDDGVFTCGGPVFTPYLTSIASDTSTVYTCAPFHAGYDSSILCPTVTRSDLTGAYNFGFVSLRNDGGLVTAGGNYAFTVTNEAIATVDEDLTLTFSGVATETAGVKTVTETVTEDADVDTATVLVTSYGRTRVVDVPVTSTSTSVITKTTTVKTCPQLRRVRARDPSPPLPTPVAGHLVKREAGYAAFDGYVDEDTTVTVWATTIYETSYYGTVTINGATETSTATVDEDGETVTQTLTTRVHDATTSFTTISKTKTEK
ncbi:hypothetical protein ABW19_dt0206485 [Dactylella cylindrospora]|nr:hypothetical protein ABW19_dt0206485 [Dactylella cylindrospora]